MKPRASSLLNFYISSIYRIWQEKSGGDADKKRKRREREERELKWELRRAFFSSFHSYWYHHSSQSIFISVWVLRVSFHRLYKSDPQSNQLLRSILDFPSPTLLSHCFLMVCFLTLLASSVDSCLVASDSEIQNLITNIFLFFSFLHLAHALLLLTLVSHVDMIGPRYQDKHWCGYSV